MGFTPTEEENRSTNEASSSIDPCQSQSLSVRLLLYGQWQQPFSLFSPTFGVDARLFYLLRTGHSAEHEGLPVLGVVAARPVELPVRGGQGQLAAAAAAADAVEIAAPAGGRRRRGTLCQAATFGCRKKSERERNCVASKKITVSR